MVQANLTTLRKKQASPPFARLPLDLRAMIWGKAAKVPQVIAPPDLWYPKNSLLCSCPLLDVNEDAKHEAVRMRSKTCYTRHLEENSDTCANSFTYINFDVGIL